MEEVITWGVGGDSITCWQMVVVYIGAVLAFGLIALPFQHLPGQSIEEGLGSGRMCPSSGSQHP